MNPLRAIQPEAEQFALVISRVLGMDVEIVDTELFRVAGTGRFAAKVGRHMDEASSVYRKVIEVGQPLVVKEPGFAEMCRECPNWQCCDETFEMSTPILHGREVLGVIGFVCFTDAQKAHIMDGFDMFFDFLSQMADLLAAKAHAAQELDRSRSVGRLLEHIVNRVDEGVLMLDREGGVLGYNQVAGELLALEPRRAMGVLDAPEEGGEHPAPGLCAVLRRGEEGMLHYQAYELDCAGGRFDVMGQLHGLEFGDCAQVFVFQDAQAMHRNAYRITSATDRIGLDILLGESEAMVELKGQIRRFARAQAPTLIMGESGTGKELIARALHDESSRAREVFVAINCSAIPETLLESELFGYVEGAFTGASPRGRMGKFEQASGGTLFLDEVGEIPLHLQAKLLRALEQGEVQRVGAQAPTPVDTRVVAATNRNLARMVDDGLFRDDLFYRLNVIPLVTPPLRERGRDVYLLARHFLELSFARLHKSFATVDDGFWKAVAAYTWPGNVRELQNAMEYIANVADSHCTVSAAMLPGKVVHSEPALDGTLLHLPTIERLTIRKALAPYGGVDASKQDKEFVARQLGIGIATLYRKLKAGGI